MFIRSLIAILLWLPTYALAQTQNDDRNHDQFTVMCDEQTNADTVETIWASDGPQAMLDLMVQFRLLAVETGVLHCSIQPIVPFTNIDRLTVRSIASWHAAGKLYRYDIVVGDRKYPLISTMSYQRFGGTVLPAH